MTDARTGTGREPGRGDIYPGGEPTPGREERTADWGDASVGGVTPGREDVAAGQGIAAEPGIAPERPDDREAPGQSVLVAGDGPGHERDAGRDGRLTPDGDRLMPTEECGQLERRLQHAVTGFVDEPRAAVEEADRAVEELSARLTDAVERRRRTLRGSWQATEGDHPGAADTEQLRLALRDYRELADRLLHI
ncbi:hypothetical protein ABTY98_00455 [Streptomyces sp. NPDC096040]|uniref:hypothetical protein n=1 Tax=Streptomyces sp. NPDC096040 TaxID=3155541 RepID=UPI0033241BD1